MSTNIDHVDFLNELKKEQSGFRIYGILFGLLFVVVALIVAAMGYYAYEQNERQQNANIDAKITIAQMVINWGTNLRQQETLNERQVEIDQESDVTRAFIAATDYSEQYADRTLAQQEQVDRFTARLAVDYARAHITGEPRQLPTSTTENPVLYNGRLNWATGPMVGNALRKPQYLTSDERQMLEAARADWLGDTNAAEAAFTALTQSRNDDARGLGYVGMATIHYARASADDEAPLGWSAGCSDAVAAANTARQTYGSHAAAMLIAQGACLRKKGDTSNAYLAFREALDLAAPGGVSAYPTTSKQLYEAYHGVGTTLIALTNNADEARNAGVTITSDTLTEARTMLETAAQYRRAWGMTNVGEVYSTENICFILLKQGEFGQTLVHTGNIDTTIALAWNLTCRLAAAGELEKAMGDADEISVTITDNNGESARTFTREDLETIAQDALLKLSLFAYGFFDEPELKRLMPSEYAVYVEAALAAHELRKTQGARNGFKTVLSGELGLDVLPDTGLF